ncbi:hypothetical protein ACFL1B_00940 [Nanoarchaeota archaeon]
MTYSDQSVMDWIFENIGRGVTYLVGLTIGMAIITSDGRELIKYTYDDLIKKESQEIAPDVDYSEYAHKAEIEGEFVSFGEGLVSRLDTLTGERGPFLKVLNTLTVKKSDGRVVIYEDHEGDDLEIECLEVRLPGPYAGETKDHKFCNSGGLDDAVVRHAQEQFNSYLTKLRNAKQEYQDSLTNAHIDLIR